MFHGSMVAIVTPMLADDSVDLESFANLIEWHIESGTDALIVLGSTGEASTLIDEEREMVLKFAVEQVRNRVPVIAGTGTNSTYRSIHYTRHAKLLGVDACLIVTPYYNKPTQAGLFQHFKMIAKEVTIPQIVYNVPSRTGCDLLPETLARLATITDIIGIKEATGDLNRLAEIKKQCDSRFDCYSGDDNTAADFMLQGGQGVISVTANVAPTLMKQMAVAALAGDEDQAKHCNQALAPLHKQLGVETNPIPVKWLLAKMGKIKEGIRLPLTQLSSQYHDDVWQAFEKARAL